jgi:hypothetical protein
MRLLLAVLLIAPLAAAQEPPKQDPPKQDPPKGPAAAPNAGPATDEEAEAAIATFKKAMSGALPSAQAAAILEVGKVRHEKVIRAILPQLRAANPDVAATAAHQLGELDHPLSAESLVAVIEGHAKHPVVLGAIFTALGKLGYESTSPALVRLIDRSSDDDWRKPLEDGFAAIGRIGSENAVDPLLDWRRKNGGFGGGGRFGRGGDFGGGRLRAACDKAIKDITGGDEETTSDWEKWWKANRADLHAGATITYRCRVLWERFDGPVGKKTPCPHASAGDKTHSSCGAFVRLRLIPEPEPSKPPGDGKQ